MYVLFGENDYEIELFINQIMNDNSINDKTVYNYHESNIDEIIIDAMYDDLFQNKKLIVIDDADFLTGKCSIESDMLNNYIDKPNQNTILVFKVLSEKLDERKKLVKNLKQKAKVLEFKKLDIKNMSDFINNYFKKKDYKIDSLAVNEIVKRINTNSEVLYTELDKLMIYKINDKEIKLEDVKKVISIYENENDVFKLVDAVIDNDKANIFKIYKELIENKNEPISLISLLASQIRLILQCKILIIDGYYKDEIASKLKEHPYRVELSIQKSYKISTKKLKNMLLLLSKIDESIKTGEVDKFRALETFFISL